MRLPNMKIKSPHELLIDQIKDLHDVETQVRATMPELSTRARSPELREYLSSQAERAGIQIERLGQAAEIIGSDPDGDVSKAMRGLIEGGDRHVAMAEGERVTNLILTAHVGRIFHYQIAGYDFARKLAGALCLTQVVYVF